MVNTENKLQDFVHGEQTTASENLEKLGFTADKIYTTLENRMKCGIGKCGRCNIGSVYVCKDGPVFTYAEIQKMPNEF